MSYSWTSAGPSRYAATVPQSPAVKTKRERFSDNRPESVVPLPSIVRPSSPLLVPRNSSSASSWGVAELSDSDGDYDWAQYAAANASPVRQPTLASRSIPNALQQSPELGRDDLAAFARPSKRPHLETSEDRQTYGQFAGLQIHPMSFTFDSNSQRPTAGRSASGMSGAFGLDADASAALLGGTLGQAAPRVPPSSPTKISSESGSSSLAASSIYQQAVATDEMSIPPPPTSPVPPSETFQSYQVVPSKRANSIDLEDSDMRIRKAPTSYEVEPDRVVVTSLDDTSSSEGDRDDQDADDGNTPDADTSTESASSEYVINNELIEKLEAHRRAVLTGTSERDNNAASSSKNGGTRSRRTGGRRSGGAETNSGLSSYGSYLSSKRRSAQSSASSSGFASPVNKTSSEDARGALILWKDPEQIMKAAVSQPATSSPLKAATGPVVKQPPPSSTTTTSPGTADKGVESPLHAQQSSLSSSYFPSSSFVDAMQTRDASTTPASEPRAWSTFDTFQFMPNSQHQHSDPSANYHQYPQTQLPAFSPHQVSHHYDPINGYHSKLPASASDEMDLDG